MARSLGFLDPVPLLTRLERLAQPSEVNAPVELLRAGALFHARGLLNARVIQYNLDWVWPYWAERQFDARSDAFIPRAFSITHVNLTHRNWTAVGLPDVDRHPLVDPRGLVTPRYDDWSLDAWLVPDSGEPLLPARAEDVEQELLLHGAGADGRLGLDGAPEGPAPAATSASGSAVVPDRPPELAVETRARGSAGRLTLRADTIRDGEPTLRMHVQARAHGPGWLAVALRPANPEGVAFIHRVERVGRSALRVDGEAEIRFDRAPDRLLMSRYHEGDVLDAVRGSGLGEERAAKGDGTDGAARESVECEAGLATVAALFRLDGEGRGEVSAHVPLAAPSDAEPGADVAAASAAARSEPGPAGPPPGAAGGPRREWAAALEGTARLQAPDDRFRFLWDAAVRSLVLHSPDDVYPGPYTYKRFWFRDAAFILDALCTVGLHERAGRSLASYPGRQERSGYFRSQEGEWDSNGAALWAMDRYRRLSGRRLPEPWIQAARKGARWIRGKRVDRDADAAHAGLLPAGFSAEHLGPNDYFYWDDFWSAAGLRAAARILREDAEDAEAADGWDREAADLLAAVDRSLRRSPGHRDTSGVPASPYRRMDAGAVGSLCASYPLALWSPRDQRMLATAEYLLDHHMVDGGFFQDMIHSGINPYLTLHLARVLLRAGDPRHETLVRTVARLASSTGQWPEAVHPRTGGGCMGDGQHTWATAEWVLAIRSWFVREEGDTLILASGIPGTWVRSGEPLELGPTPTPRGPVTVRVTGTGDGALVEWSATWRGEPPPLEVRLPGHAPVVPEPGAQAVRTAGDAPAPSSSGTGL